jgi:hypothetical protein
MLMEKEKVLRRIVITLTILLVLTAGVSALMVYLFTPTIPCRPELIYLGVGANTENNSVSILIKNASGAVATIEDILQIELVNYTYTQNPINALDEDLHSHNFPLELDLEEIINLTCIFADPLTISGNYSLYIYYNAGKVLEVDFTFNDFLVN